LRLSRGTLTRRDCAWSRDAACGRYVQHLCAAADADLKDWMENGAARSWWAAACKT